MWDRWIRNAPTGGPGSQCTPVAARDDLLRSGPNSPARCCGRTLRPSGRPENPPEPESRPPRSLKTRWAAPSEANRHPRTARTIGPAAPRLPRPAIGPAPARRAAAPIPRDRPNRNYSDPRPWPCRPVRKCAHGRAPAQGNRSTARRVGARRIHLSSAASRRGRDSPARLPAHRRARSASAHPAGRRSTIIHGATVYRLLPNRLFGMALRVVFRSPMHGG